MTDRPTDSSQLPPGRAPRRSLLSARKFALMASVVAGLGVAAYGLAPVGHDVLTSAAHAQVNKEVRQVQQPVGFADIVERVKPSVISVRVKVAEKSGDLNSDDNPFPPGSPMERFFRRFGGPDGFPGGPGGRGPRGRQFVTGQGSGFFISADGYAVTNNHVVDGADKVEVTTDDGKTYTAKVIGSDPRTDVALIKVDGRSDFPFAKLSDTQPRIGDWVLAVGNPFGLGGTVTAGIVSARGRDIAGSAYGDFLQIDAAVNTGNSGGPAFNLNGDVVGVNTAIFSPNGGNVGIAFAIPSNVVKQVTTQLIENGSVTRGFLGVGIQDVNRDIADSVGLKSARGALVTEPSAGGPADKAGIKSGDVIVKVDGDEIQDALDLSRTIAAKDPGTAVKIDLWRSGKEESVEVTLDTLDDTKVAAVEEPAQPETPAAPAPSSVGITVVPNSGGEGLLIQDIDAASIAAEKGFQVGDAILEVDNQKVATADEFEKALSSVKDSGRGTALIKAQRDGNSRFIGLPLTATN
jgi:serine protease Do